MQTKHKNTFTTIHTEGAILPPDLLQKVLDNDKNLPGLNPEDYHLGKNEKLNEAINRSWNRLLGVWSGFRTAAEKLAEGDTGATITREKWLLILFQELGYGRLSLARGLEIEGKSYPISHIWENTPIHLVGCRIDLDRRTTGVAGASRMSPHSMVQEFLNRSKENLWAFVSNGLTLRILRDNVSLTRQAYVEFDLNSMMNGEVYSDFALLWLLCHQSRVEGEKPEECYLEKWSRNAYEQGTRALEQLRAGVEEAITVLGKGFLKYKGNRSLREKLKFGEILTQDYYRQLLRLVYRLLFLFVAEDRDLLLLPDTSESAKEIYTKYYSTTRLRNLAGKRRGTKHSDFYQGLKVIMDKLSYKGCSEIALPALGSYLWSEGALQDIYKCDISNSDFLDAIRTLSYTVDKNTKRSVDYKNLGSEELGSVYESLLELHPVINADTGEFTLKTAGGSERKTTGSYYTPSSLISCLLDSALDPVLQEARKKPNPESEILSLKICDPACGSGHFLIAAAHRVARKLASVRTGDDEPAPEAVKSAIRDVIGKCIYGVDLNEMAVELCKVNLWMEALEPGKPLSFLDHHIKCGNSLIGAIPALIEKGIPDEAFIPIVGDDKSVCTEYKKKNNSERSGYGDLFYEKTEEFLPWEHLGNLAIAMMGLDKIDDNNIEGVRDKQKRYEELVKTTGYLFGKLLSDAWCASFVWKKTIDLPYPITEGVFRKIERNPHTIPSWMKDEIIKLSEQYKFFHWHLEFPDVFRLPVSGEKSENKAVGWCGGFDVVLGNPPWEKYTISEEEWFASRHTVIGQTKEKARRDKLIADLQIEDPELYISWKDSLRTADAYGLILSQKSGKYPLTGSGELNTYQIFTELTDHIVASYGRVGIIVKTGISSAENCLPLFKKLTDNSQLVSLYDFVNVKRLFPAVKTVERFSLITFSGISSKQKDIYFATILQDISDLSEPERIYKLTPKDISLMSPINGAAPLLKSRRDSHIMSKIYREFPILGEKDEKKPDEFWNITYTRIFDMASDSKYFKRREELEENGYKMDVQRRFLTEDEEFLPLYEGKYIYLMEHRYGSFENVPVSKRYGRKASAPNPTNQQLQNPYYEIIPRYWFPKSLWLNRQNQKNLRGDYAFHFRDVTGVYPHIRTAIGSICPAGPAGHKAPVITILNTFSKKYDSQRILLFASIFCSLPFDYIVRNKLYSNSFSLTTLSQIPMPSPHLTLKGDGPYNKLFLSLLKTALELSFTTWSLEPIGKALGYEAPFVWNYERRFLLLREIDAFAAHLYGLSREELEYVLSTFQTLEQANIREYGDFRTKKIVIEAYDRMQLTMENGGEYRSLLDPPPADPKVSHTVFKKER